jgi:hypothetical protein
MRYVFWIGFVAFVLFLVQEMVAPQLARYEQPPTPQTVSVPPSNADVEGRLAQAIDALPRGTTGPPQPTLGGGPAPGGSLGPGPRPGLPGPSSGPAYPSGLPGPEADLTKWVRPLASAIASKLKNYPTEYNKPGDLQLGESTPVQLVIKTDEKQDTGPLFAGLEGKVQPTTVLVANDVSAQLTGPPDRLQITQRGDKMRTISSPVPITWVWDVKPLKPGKAQVMLEVTSYIKIGKDKEPVPIRVLQDTWEVEAHGMEWVKYQIEQIEPIQAFVAAVGTMVVGALAWFGIKGRGKDKPDFES